MSYTMEYLKHWTVQIIKHNYYTISDYLFKVKFYAYHDIHANRILRVPQELVEVLVYTEY